MALMVAQCWKINVEAGVQHEWGKQLMKYVIPCNNKAATLTTKFINYKSKYRFSQKIWKGTFPEINKEKFAKITLAHQVAMPTRRNQNKYSKGI